MFREKCNFLCDNQASNLPLAVAIPISFRHRHAGSSILRHRPNTRMRLLVLSDLHANLTALEAALSAAKGSWDNAVCLGDVVGYGPDPNEVTSQVRELATVTIRGNHDKAVAELMVTDDFNPIARAAVQWTRAQLSNENLDWLASLPQGPLEAEGVVLVHGAFQDEDEYVFTPSQALEGLLDSTLPVTFYGHTHHQGGFSYQETQLEVLQLHPRDTEARSALRIDKMKRYLLNPGSIGQPRDGDPRASFAIADLENQVVEFWRVPYDVEDVQERMRTARLPEPLALRLSVGR
jgi:diadenosine tetraphosphatase ApaH/serine/threonine PP2A family protein phosphatase